MGWEIVIDHWPQQWHELIPRRYVDRRLRLLSFLLFFEWSWFHSITEIPCPQNRKNFTSSQLSIDRAIQRTQDCLARVELPQSYNITIDTPSVNPLVIDSLLDIFVSLSDVEKNSSHHYYFSRDRGSQSILARTTHSYHIIGERERGQRIKDSFVPDWIYQSTLPFFVLPFSSLLRRINQSTHQNINHYGITCDNSNTPSFLY